MNRHLNLLSLILGAVVKRGLIWSSPVALVDRPGEPRRRWRILSPVEIRAVERAFAELIAEGHGAERLWRETVRLVVPRRLRDRLGRGELLGVDWRSVDLADPEGAPLRLEETFVRSAADTPKSAAGGERYIAAKRRTSEALPDELTLRPRSAAEKGRRLRSSREGTAPPTGRAAFQWEGAVLPADDKSRRRAHRPRRCCGALVADRRR